VCLSSYGPEEAYTLSTCGHTHHKGCLVDNVIIGLGRGEVGVPCYTSGCGISIMDSDLNSIVAFKGGVESALIMSRLKRLRLSKTDKSVRFCPTCQGAVFGGGATSAALQCGECGGAFCFLHSTAHPPGAAACKEYAATLARDPNTLATEEEIRKSSQKCPTPDCGTFMQRVGGCNSLVCSTCGVTFCWLCGCEIDQADLPAHYQWWNFKSDCRFRQFVDVKGPISLALRVALNLVSLVYGLLFGIPGMLLTALACSFCLFYPVRVAPGGFLANVLTISSVVSSILCIIVCTIATIPVMVPLFVAGLVVRLFRFLVGGCRGGGSGGSGDSAPPALALPPSPPPHSPSRPVPVSEALAVGGDTSAPGRGGSDASNSITGSNGPLNPESVPIIVTDT